MMVFTARLNKRRAIVGVAALAVLLISVVLLAGRRDSNRNESQNVDPAQAASVVVRDNAERLEFLQGFGWELETTPIEEQTVVIPRAFTEVYERYNALQAEQGFDLSKYAGCEATRYTYRILNYPGEEGVRAVADLVVFESAIIAGDVQCNRFGGFMHGLEMPE